MKNLTQREQQALSKAYNLADGHAHNSSSPYFEGMIDLLPAIYKSARDNNQSDIERAFLENFFNLAAQGRSNKLETSLLWPSASIATEGVANLLRKLNVRVGLIQPIFDNIPNMFQSLGIDIVPIDEQNVIPEIDIDYIASKKVDAIFLACPNNPTGRIIGRESFEKLVNYCARQGIILIIDFCFRFFAPSLFDWDQYESVINHKCEYVFIEDTGKTWPTLDLKVSVTTVSSKIYDGLFLIHNDYLLNISPFILELLNSVIEMTQQKHVAVVVSEIVRANRDYLRAKLRETSLSPENLESTISVEWLRIGYHLKSQELCDHLETGGVYTLPGEFFFWNDPALGKDFLRIALMRDEGRFKLAVDRLMELVRILP